MELAYKLHIMFLKNKMNRIASKIVDIAYVLC